MLLNQIIDRAYRTDGRRVLAGLIRLTGDIDAAEDALQDACARALVVWRDSGIPESPGAWLNTVARRAAIDRMRRDRSTPLPADLEAASTTDPFDDPSGIEDDRLRLLFTCCHPAISPEAQCALALRTLGGLTTREIARAFVETETATAQRLVRAKKKIREARIPYEVPARHRLKERTDIVLSVLYLIFNEGYLSTADPALVRPDLVAEATRLARLACQLLPESAEARGLLALMLLTDARRPARISASGEMIPLEEQDRSKWNTGKIAEGMAILDEAMAMRAPGPYQIQAAIAALHGKALDAAQTDWRQIAALYRSLLRWQPTPVVELNAAIAAGMAEGFERGLDWIDRIEASGALDGYYLLHAARADLLRRSGRFAEAARSYESALGQVVNPAERAYLERRASECFEKV